MAAANGPAPPADPPVRAAVGPLRVEFCARFWAADGRVRPPAAGRSVPGRPVVDFRARAGEDVRVAMPRGYPDNHFGHIRHTPIRPGALATDSSELHSLVERWLHTGDHAPL
jgi:hypothetical protein